MTFIQLGTQHEYLQFNVSSKHPVYISSHLLDITSWPPSGISNLTYPKYHSRGASRWRRSKTWRSPSSPQIHQKYMYMWNNSYRTPTERWQTTSDFPRGKKLPTYLGRAREKRNNRDKRIGTGPAPVGGSCEGGKVSTH